MVGLTVSQGYTVSQTIHHQPLSAEIDATLLLAVAQAAYRDYAEAGHDKYAERCGEVMRIAEIEGLDLVHVGEADLHILAPYFAEVQ